MTQKNSNPPPTFERPAPPPNPPPAERSVSLAMYETMRRERDTARQALRDMHPGIVCEKCGASKRSDEMHSDICYGCAWIEQSFKLSSTEKRLYIALSGLRRVAWNDPPLNGPGVFAYSLAAERSFYNAGGYEEHRRLCEHVPNEAAITRQCTLCGDIPEAPK